MFIMWEVEFVCMCLWERASMYDQMCMHAYVYVGQISFYTKCSY